jgi:leader peptidase (prepilin peptidase) / N-methyltransferase
MRLDEVIAMLPGWFPAVLAFTFGLLWGSFLNVVIYRVPRELSVVRPASHCPGCGKPIAGYDNVPVLSYVLLRGKARCCGARMSPRYPLVELIGGALSLAILQGIVLALPSDTSLVRALAVYGAYFALCLGLVAAAFIDAEHMFLPDSITIGGIVVGLATATLRGLELTDAVIGGAVGFLVIWLPFIFLYKGLLGRTGMGLGDAKLLALAGAWLGWPGAVFALLAGAIQGTLYAGVLRVLGVQPKLPQAVQDEIDELEKAAAEGDEDAIEALAEDPLTEDEDDAFILNFFRRLLRGKEKPEAATDAEPEGDVEVGPPRARIPFGPFIILSILELVFLGDVIERYFPLFWP